MKTSKTPFAFKLQPKGNNQTEVTNKRRARLAQEANAVYAQMGISLRAFEAIKTGLLFLSDYNNLLTDQEAELIEQNIDQLRTILQRVARKYDGQQLAMAKAAEGVKLASVWADKLPEYLSEAETRDLAPVLAKLRNLAKTFFLLKQEKIAKAVKMEEKMSKVRKDIRKQARVKEASQNQVKEKPQNPSPKPAPDMTLSAKQLLQGAAREIARKEMAKKANQGPKPDTKDEDSQE